MRKHIIDIFSGILIAIGAYANLKVGGLLGPFLFSFGIVAIVGCNLKLYTGVAGTDEKIMEKVKVLVMNVIGACLGAFLIYLCDTNIHETAHKICTNKLITSPLIGFFKAIMCGVIVDVSVFMSKDKKSFIPLILGIPVFIFCGFNSLLLLFLLFSSLLKFSIFKFRLELISLKSSLFLLNSLTRSSIKSKFCNSSGIVLIYS